VAHVCLSHLHSDHIGGLEHLGFTARFVNHTRPALYAPEPLFDRLWPHALEAAMGEAEGSSTLQSYFETRPLAPGRPALFGSVEALPVAVPHVLGRPSYGYLLSDKETGGRAFLTCDSRYAPELLAACAEEADLVFHDCEWGEPASGVHARLEELLQLPESLQRKVFLVHYRDDWEMYGGKTGAMRLARAGVPYDL
jgi:ribonuclease BN (tRNA processing enzyme)